MQTPLVIARARALAEDALSENRRTHVYAVAEECSALAELFELGDKTSDLFCAALLHDITKEKSGEAQLQLCREYGIILCADDEKTPKMLHAKTAAEFAAREFELPGEFCDAIRYHTTGRAQMTLYDKLLFLADYIEKTRTYAPCRRLRRQFWRRARAAKTASERLLVLDDCVLCGLDTTLSELIDEARHIHKDTLDARNNLLEIIQEKKEESK